MARRQKPQKAKFRQRHRKWNRHYGELIPFSTREGQGFVVGILAAMVFLALLAAAASLMMLGSLGQWQESLSRTATIQLLPNLETPPNQQLDQLDRQVASLVQVLRATEGVVKATPLSEAANRAILAPFLGNADLTDLPVPRLIDLTINPEKFSEARLLVQLKNNFPNARVNLHADWLEGFIRLSHILELIGLAVVILVFSVALAMVIIVTRSSLTIHIELVTLLHQLGASENFIASAFVWHMVRMAFRGVIFGGAAASSLILSIGLLQGNINNNSDRTLTDGFSSIVSSGLQLSSGGWLILLAIAVTLIVLTGMAARRQVVKQIRLFP